ncbi:M48 family metalloprotease [Phenylobacterium sp.]|uniref:M48 family metalloprotease n=1 Tax=Phenylobacterium sp. TaxID=1871053 RepID=UPI002C8F3552|nr:M48 family metalloprotease [Phenylobacterium sp.]HLZ77062.1 M48 family metalloprotease [Phenylobacterium sp.]
MAAPARPVFRIVLAAALTFSLVLQPGRAAAQFAPGDYLVRDTEIEDILRRQVTPLFDAAGIDSKSIQIVLVASREPNASAGPGVMMVTTSLILQADNPNQLQGVMAHEIGHLAGGHSFRSGEYSRAGMVPMILTMGLGVLAAIAGSGDAAAGLISSAPMFGAIGAAGYGREQEARADQAGATYMEKAGLSARGLVEFLDKNRYQEIFNQYRRFRYFIDHPLSSERVESLQTRVATLPHYYVKDSPRSVSEHEIMKAKLDGFINPVVSMGKYDEKDMSYPARYARAIAYYQMKEPEKALKRVDALLAEQPNNPYLWELKGQIMFEFGQVEGAEAPQRRSVELRPNAPLLRINLGQTLIALGNRAKTEEGIAELKKALTQEEDNAAAWRVLAEAYDKHGDEGLARLATAEYDYNIGNMKLAREFAIRARERLSKDSPEWRRATDIVLVSKPTPDEERRIAGGG